VSGTQRRRRSRFGTTAFASCCAAGVLAACAGGSSGGSSHPIEQESQGQSDEAAREPSEAQPGLQQFFGADVAPRDDGAFGLDRWTALPAEPGAGPGPAIRVDFPAGSVSPSASREHGAPEGGMQVFLPLVGEPLDAAHLRYWVRFPADFEFVKGGKLPGLYGGEEVSGGEEPDGTDGFSTRLMWRADGDAEVYLYAPDESGTSLGRGDWVWPTGEWTCVEQQVVLNAPNDENGSVTVWLDGQEMFSENDMQYRTVDDLKVEGIFFSTFFGGADPSWAPSQDQQADFAGFEISPDPIGCDAG